MSPFNSMLMSKRSPGAEGVKLTKCFFSSYLFFIFYIFIQISFRRFSIARLREVKLSYIVILGFFFFLIIFLLSYQWMTSQHMYVLRHSQKWLCPIQAIFNYLFFKQTRLLPMVLKWNHGQDIIHTIFLYMCRKLRQPFCSNTLT